MARTRLLFVLSAVMLGGCASLADRAPARPQWGVQLYTVRADMAKDPDAVLRRVREAGYDAVEFAGTHGAPPQRLCATARALGLSVAAAHADWSLLRDDPAAALAEARALCADTLMLAWLPPEERTTLDQWRDWVTRLNGIAEMGARQGMRVAYHAHDFEFMPVEGQRPIDLLMAGLDPRIGFELDTYWLAKAGVDPLSFLVRHRDRVSHLHLKDMAADGSMADLGQGRLPLAAIITQARRQGVRHFLVERDDAPDPWASLATSLDSLRAMPFQP